MTAVTPNNAVAEAPQILCVDDESAVLDGMELNLRRLGRVRVASSGAEALERIAKEGPFALVISDMRMPGMDGAALLSKIREVSPNTVRLLLTGQAELDSAIAAVNEGQIFRFLTKPCPAETLLRAVTDALQQHRLVLAEKELLDRTLRGAVKALSEVLSIVDPKSFGRSGRIQRLAMGLAKCVALEPNWPLELAALLQSLGNVSLPPELTHRAHLGQDLTVREREMIARVPELTDKLLAPIPRLDLVRSILREAAKGTGGTIAPSGTPELQLLLRSARILRLSMDFEELEARGLEASAAVAELKSRSNAYEAMLLEALTELKHAEATGGEVRQIQLRYLKAGMVLAEDLCATSGQLLVARGFHVTTSFIERLRNFKPGSVRDTIRVIQPHDLEHDEHAA